MKNIKNIFQVKIILLNIIFFASVFFQCVNAEMNFQGCYMPWEFGDAQKSYIYVRPLGDKCNKICENQCEKFSQPRAFDTTNCKDREGSNCYQLAKNNAINSLTGPQLNQDIIEQCMVDCRQGKTYSSDYRIADDSQSSVFGWNWAKKTITTDTACVDSKDDKDGSNDETANYAYFPISYDVKNGDKVTFSLGNSDSQYGNTLFLCGFQTKRITPGHWYVDPNERNLNGPWDVRSSKFYDTGIPLKNKDYIRFAYGGKVFGNYIGKGKATGLPPYVSDNFPYQPDRTDLDLSFNGQCFDGKSYFPGDQMSTCYYNANEQKSYCMTKDNKTIECKDGSCRGLGGDNIIDRSKDERKCFLRSTRNIFVKKNLDVNGFSASDMPLDKFEFSGYVDNYKNDDPTLQIKYKDNYIKTVSCYEEGSNCGNRCVDKPWYCKLDIVNCCKKWEAFCNYSTTCNTYYDGKLVSTNSGNSQEAEKHPVKQPWTLPSETVARDYSKSFGGYEVEINWKGCPVHNGEGLQYALVPATSDSKYEPWDTNTQWLDAEQYISGNKEITISGIKEVKKKGCEKSGSAIKGCEKPGSARIFFRINPDTIPKGRENTLGSYGVIVNKKDTPSKNVSGVISDIVNTITKFFIGDDGNQSNSGKVQYIFNKLTQDTIIVNGIRALLVLYLVYTGISFMIGFARITQKEAINRVLKITFVVMIISPNSWVFFNTYLFGALLNGSMELVYDIIQPIASVQSINVSNASHSELVKAVFSMFDEIFYQLFNNVIWTKIWALFCTSLVGVFIGLLMIVAIISYLTCALRVIVTYIYSMITLCILFILAPIFISFMLFEKTSKLFRSWINNMISMVFQPVFTFAALAILHKVFIMTLHASLFFTACPTCLISFDFPGFHWCVPWENAWWVALYGAHFPLEASMSSPINMILPVFAVLIVVQAMDGMVRFASSYANKIATNSFYGFDLESIAIKTQSYATGMMSKAANTALGTGGYSLKDDENKKGDGSKDSSKNKADKVKRK